MLACASAGRRARLPARRDRPDGLHRSNLARCAGALHALAPPAEVSSSTASGSGPTAPPHRAVVDGDAKSAAIAAASIVAKVTRDRDMRRLDALYPATASPRTWATSRPATAPSSARAARREIHRRSFRARCYGDEPASRLQPQALGTEAERRAALATTGCAATGSSTTNVWIGRLRARPRRAPRPPVVFCEVKAKSGARCGDPLEMVTAEKQRRIRLAAEAWLAAHPGHRGPRSASTSPPNGRQARARVTAF